MVTLFMRIHFVGSWSIVSSRVSATKFLFGFLHRLSISPSPLLVSETTIRQRPEKISSSSLFLSFILLLFQCNSRVIGGYRHIFVSLIGGCTLYEVWNTGFCFVKPLLSYGNLVPMQLIFGSYTTSQHSYQEFLRRSCILELLTS